MHGPAQRRERVPHRGRRSSSGPLAQSVEHRTFNPLVDGSNPSRPTIRIKHLRRRFGEKSATSVINSVIRQNPNRLATWPATIAASGMLHGGLSRVPQVAFSDLRPSFRESSINTKYWWRRAVSAGKLDPLNSTSLSFWRLPSLSKDDGAPGVCDQEHHLRVELLGKNHSLSILLLPGPRGDLLRVSNGNVRCAVRWTPSD